jgi:cellulose synthase/poly-beta-1,6-N-acetylglucosamine synthase-like glycosyltransferase
MFWVTFALLAFNFYGYIIVLFALAHWLPLPLPRARKQPEPAEDDPVFCLLVPTYNEIRFLRGKIENLLRQRYVSGKRRILICDGGSTDGSRESVADLIGPGVEWLDCPRPGKVLQLNHGLAHVAEGGYVAVSDADSLFVDDDALLRAYDYLRNPGVGVVGAWGIPDPERAATSERAYWDKQNRLRFLETRAISSSIVTAHFYAFRRSLLRFFPEDCVADDVHAAFAAHLRNERVVYAHDIEAYELRQPQGMAETLRHKFRKAHAYTSELLRPLHLLPVFGKRRKFIYLFKIFQFFHLPWSVVFFLGSAGVYAYHGRWVSIAAAFALLFLGTLSGSFLIQPPPSKTRGGISPIAAIHTIYVFTLVNIVLLANSVAYPFWRQDSRYQKVMK